MRETSESRAAGPRRVLVASQSQVRVGGRETYVAAVLAALRDAGHEVACWFESDETGPDLVLDRAPNVQIWTGTVTATPSADGGLAAIRAWRPDVVFVNSVESPAWERALQTLAPAVRFLHSYDGACVSGTKTFTRPGIEPCHRVLGPGCLAHYFPRGCGGKSPATLVRLYRAERERQSLLRGYARLLVASRHMREEYARQGLGDVVRVVPLPVETPGRPMADLPPRNLSEPARPWRLLYLGRFEPTKGPELALEAAALAAGATSHAVTLQLSGDGALRARLAERANRLMADVPGLTVEMTPWLTRDDTLAALDASDLLVVPSVWPEPFGMVGVEAARRGVPAVAFAVGGIADWLSDGRTGALVEAPPTAERLAGAVAAVLGDAARWHTMRETCVREAKRFTASAHVRALEAIFDEVLDHQPVPNLMPHAAKVDIRSGTKL